LSERDENPEKMYLVEKGREDRAVAFQKSLGLTPKKRLRRYRDEY